MFDFPITVKSIDEVPEEYRFLYDVEDGKDGATLTGPLKKKIEGGTGLHKALETERKAKAAAEKSAKAWKDAAGVDTPEDLGTRFSTLETEHAAALEEARKEAGPGKGSDDREATERRVQQVKDEKDREWRKKLEVAEANTKKAEDKTAQMWSSLERYMKEHAALAAITTNKGRPSLLKRIVMDHLKIVEDEGGKFGLIVVDEDGDERYDGEGKRMSVENLVAQMRSHDDYASAFDGDGATGSGSRSPGGAPKTSKVNPFLKATENVTQQGKLLKENPQLAAQFKAAAEAERRAAR